MNTTTINTTAINTTLPHIQPLSIPPLLPTIGGSMNEDTSTQNDTTSEDNEQQHIKVEKNGIKHDQDNMKLNYDDLVVALWNMVEKNTINNNTANNTVQHTKTNINPINRTDNNNILNTNTSFNHSLHSKHSTQSAVTLSTSFESSSAADNDNDDDLLPICSVSPTSSIFSTIKPKQKRQRERETPHVSVLSYCPNYLSYDSRARKESKERISSHLRERQKLVKKCICSAIADVDALGLDFSAERSQYASFCDNNDILSVALGQLRSQIDSWDGVQIKQCKKSERDGTPIVIDSWQKFAKKAKNHQDQTSWKISGDYFFAPYIKKVSIYIDRYCNCLINISSDLKREIISLASISFAMNLLNGKIKFHRTKLKPLIRHRTLVKSSGIHIELENLFSKLTIRKFIQNAKAERKENDGKSNIIAGDFYDKLIKYIENEYEIQKQRVHTLINQHKMNKLLPPIPLPIMNNNNLVPIIVNKKRKRIETEEEMVIPNKKRKYEYNIMEHQQIEYKIYFEYILSSCNGECGNKLGTFIANILYPSNEQFMLSKQEQLNVLALKFGEYHNKMRDYLISLLKCANIDWLKNELFCSLQNENMYISNALCKDGERCISMFCESFKSLLNENKEYILSKLVSKSCKRCDIELLEEIRRNNIMINMDEIHCKIEIIKNSSNYYQNMKLIGNGLTNNEIIACNILIKHSNSIYFDWNNNGNSCKWKELFNNICSAINKIYKIFIYKNNKYNKEFPNKLFTTKNKYNTINILSQNKSNHQTKVIKDVKNALYNGQLVAAPIDWICNNNNNNNFKNNLQWISLPTIL